MRRFPAVITLIQWWLGWQRDFFTGRRYVIFQTVTYLCYTLLPALIAKQSSDKAEQE